MKSIVPLKYFSFHKNMMFVGSPTTPTFKGKKYLELRIIKLTLR